MIATRSTESTANTIAIPQGQFSAELWLRYFEENKQSKVGLRFTEQLDFSPALRAPLIYSLQKFQIGETGEGKKLRKFAATLNNPAYEQCMDLFIKEEQSHARILAEMIASLDGTLLTWDWTDLVFIGLRRMMGLKTELFILLIAEIVGKCFYLECARKLPNERMCNAFSIIVLDEIAHLEFHSEFLASRLKQMPEPMRYFVYWCWSVIFYAACFVFIFDHKRTLAALEVTPKDFLGECSKVFHRAASKCLLVNP